MVRFQIVLSSQEGEALARWAESQLREPREQVRLLLREALELQGLLERVEPVADRGEEGTNHGRH